MIEKWLQFTCDGCGATDYHPFPNETQAVVRSSLKKGGWRSYGKLDYCAKCVKNGNAAKRVTDMNS